MRYITTIIALLLTFGIGMAQKNANAKDVLDATASRLTNEKGVQANFKAEIFNDGVSQGYTMGTMSFMNNKFQMTTPDIISWYDGSTQWSNIKANEEVNVSTPTPEEQENMNPYVFVNLYKNGYKYKMKETELRGEPCYEVTLTAKSKKKNVHTLILNINKKDYSLMCVRMTDRQSGKWTRISIHDFKSGLTFGEDDFKFNAKDFPNAEIIDLR